MMLGLKGVEKLMSLSQPTELQVLIGSLCYLNLIYRFSQA